ncbi:hypothetical protein [Dactylosporangium sp. CA-092794]|uniref:hypothetical protein n=1 Tax=Dactylosporangium sp. CA-092794 TaxID=3239929 RepID=UPI003D8CEA1C
MAEHRQTEHTDPTTSHPGSVGQLDPNDVLALRAADTITFHTNAASVARIDAGLSSAAFAQPRIYTSRQQRLFPDGDRLDRRRRIQVGGAIAGFDDVRRWREHDLPGAAALAVFDAAHLHEVWRSIAALLRPGDVLRLHWRADDSSDALTDPALHRDELRLGVTRGARRWLFLLAVHVLPEPARMITRVAAADTAAGSGIGG